MKKKIFIVFSSLLALTSCATVSIFDASKNPHKGDIITPTNKIQISFDANGGVLSGVNTLEIESGAKYSSFKNKVPTVTREGATRKAKPWFYNSNIEVDDNTTFNQSTTLFANWYTYNISFDPGEGTWDGTSKEIKIISNTTYVHLDDIQTPQCVGKKFEGWYLNDSKISFPYTPNTNVTLKAKYTTDYVYLAFLSLQGYWTSNLKYKIIAIPYGTEWKDIKDVKTIIPTDPLYDGDKLFSSWQINDAEIPLNYKFTSSTLITATYENAISLTFDVNTNGGVFDGGSSTEIVSPKIKHASNPTFLDFKNAANLPNSKSKEGSYELLGWFNESYATNAAIKDSDLITATSSYRVYAYYKVPHTITFNGITDGYKVTETITPFIRKDNLTYHVNGNPGYTLTADLLSVKWNGEIKTRTVDYDFVVENNEGVLTINNAPGYDITVTVNPTINDYKLSLVTTELEDHIYKINTTTDVSSIDVTYLDSILDNINSNVTAYHPYGELRGWSLDNGATFITSSKTMPYSDQTIKVFWNKYNFKFINNTKGSVSGTTEYNQVYLKKADLSNLVVTPVTGYSFTNTYQMLDANDQIIGTTDFTNPIAPAKFTTPLAHDATIKLKPIFSANSYRVSFNSNGGHLTSSTPININYEDKILDANIPTATHDYGVFKGWVINDGDTIIDSTTTMPYNDITLKAVWNTCSINLSAVHGSVSTAKFDNRLILHDDEFTVTPESGYKIDHYEYSFDNSNWATLTSGMPFKPFVIKSDLADKANVYLKAVCTRTVEIILDGDGGYFSTGENFLVINVDYNKTWGDILSTLPTSTSKGTIDYWMDDQGQQISSSKIITSTFIAKAHYSGGE